MGDLPFEKMERTIMVRQHLTTSDKFGKRPQDRTIPELLDAGVVNIDKPSGPTSHQISDYAQKILHIDKAGHTGTLDPKVTGVLAVALSRATKVVQAMLTSGKEYICVMHLHNEVPEDKIREVMASFVGKIKQLPPIKSAVKRQWRFRKIYYIDIHEIDGQDVLFTVGCQAGTYIRKLCHDIGEACGTGAHMAQLRRTKAGPFNESTLCTLHDLTDAYHAYEKENDPKPLSKLLMPVEKAVEHLPKVWVSDTAVDPVCNGMSLMAPGIAKVESDIQIDEDIAMLTLKDELIAVGKAKMISKDMCKSPKGIAIKTEKVFMKVGTYPKYAKQAR